MTGLAPRAGVTLASCCTLGVGGPARWFAVAHDVDDLLAADEWSRAHEAPLFVLGGGSNLVIADEGWDGLVVHADVRGIEIGARGGDGTVRVGAGEPWDNVVEATVRRGLAGLECLSGIPGSTGGTPIQNVGAYGQEVGAVIQRVSAIDRRSRRLCEIAAAECGFGYRTSRFKGADAGRFIVCGVTFLLRDGPPTATYPDIERFLRDAGLSSPSLADVRRAVLEVRRRKGMVLDDADPDTRSVGSFFTNPVVSRDDVERLAEVSGRSVPGYAVASGVKVPAAWLIEQSGFRKGDGEGPVGISTKHPLALVNRGGATARDVVRFAVRVKRQVADRFGVALQPEPVFAGFDRDDPDIAYLTGSSST